MTNRQKNRHTDRQTYGPWTYTRTDIDGARHVLLVAIAWSSPLSGTLPHLICLSMFTYVGPLDLSPHPTVQLYVAESTNLYSDRNNSSCPSNLQQISTESVEKVWWRPNSRQVLRGVPLARNPVECTFHQLHLKPVLYLDRAPPRAAGRRVRAFE